jgi:hypothetical protein
MMTAANLEDGTPPDATRRPRRLSGRWVVIGMFVFGIAATAGLWVYWKLHVGPFLPLQQALAEEFENAAPHVDGGQRKKHKRTPRILRITMKVAFDPTVPANQSQVEQVAERVIAIARQQPDFRHYDELEIYLFWPVQEQERTPPTAKIIRKVADVLAPP